MTGPFSPRIRALASISPFTGPETLERQHGRAFQARLGANESVFGPSPKAIDAMARAAETSWMYGDPEQFALREALASKLGISRDCVVCGVGIDGLLRDLVAAACDPGSTVLASLGAYPTFGYFAVAAGAAVETVPYTPDYRQDLPALAARANELGPRILYLTNPDNPTGSWASADEVEALVLKVPENTLIVLDEAYCEFAPARATLPAHYLRPNFVRLRTFSKAYGMAGVRVGYAFGDPNAIAQIHKVRDHFSLSRIAQAGALAALSDADHLAFTIDAVEKGRSLLGKVAERFGFRALPSATNFVAMDLGRGEEHCRALAEDIAKQGVFVRRPGAPFLNRTLRVSVGTPQDVECFEAALSKAVEAIDG
ncbi:aminotransferase class I/II-fold pyridoxal phosphate-dependent enzyme [Fulvimarina sp. 2208YS6-2-32]|uniref:Aminotransferase class I/II-fold pyridoxal phosphate-dependent enzyme n=1 Tax=Fulvimarina uroteuthidis TaxID=3098149 RepID=A0ABU5I5S0_9HYPH|nr:aminotransferase class I/II-fold pyridoxal phosphate-dependent enzyme [Fulvimarina sp. 2208YS6-2-32]MDY8110442.1 aminotransferase class I/II-fold pyridoxal phosphate-dependent enzyme [Fulvimarina sp. 2208YS6-2-32]